MLSGAEFIAVAGGTIFQIFIPAICAFYFAATNQTISSYIMILWLGNSWFDISIYAKDAIFMELPLSNPFINNMSSAEDIIHDWNYMLKSLNILYKAQLVGNLFVVVGVVTTLIGIYKLIAFSTKDRF